MDLFNKKDGKQAAAPGVDDALQDELHTEGMPSVGRRKGGNKLVNILGIIVIIGFGVAMAVAVNGGKKGEPKVKKESAKPESVTNNLPPLVVPDRPASFAPDRPEPLKVSAPAGASNGTTGGTKPIGLRDEAGSGMRGSRPYGGNGKPALTWEERKMGNDSVVAWGGGGSSSNAAKDPQRGDAIKLLQERLKNGEPIDGSGVAGGGHGSQGGGDLASKLEPTVMKGATASMLPDRNFIITKGTSLDCALETALDSSVPGLTTCRLTRDIYSDNGQVVLLDRGTQLVGEYQGGLKNGQARLFVLWSRAKTPNGVIVALNSPGADALGRSGLEGWVDTHFAERFGAALLISSLKDTYAYIIARQQQSGNGPIIYGNTAQGADKMAEKALDATVNIPPTLFKNQGDHIQVMVARDLDFSTVYGLQVNN